MALPLEFCCFEDQCRMNAEETYLFLLTNRKTSPYAREGNRFRTSASHRVIALTYGTNGIYVVH